jgi:hypothetical protein
MTKRTSNLVTDDSATPTTVTMKVVVPKKTCSNAAIRSQGTFGKLSWNFSLSND